MAEADVRSRRRAEDPRMLAGAGTFVDDVRLDRTCHLAFLRSSNAHARIVRVETTAASHLPDVLAVFSGAELCAIVPPLPLLLPAGQPRELTRPVAASELALYAGQPVAAVVAKSRYAAEDALEAIEVEYEPLPVVADVERALAPDAPHLRPDWEDNVVATVTMGTPLATASDAAPSQSAAPGITSPDAAQSESNARGATSSDSGPAARGAITSDKAQSARAASGAKPSVAASALRPASGGSMSEAETQSEPAAFGADTSAAAHSEPAAFGADAAKTAWPQPTLRSVSAPASGEACVVRERFSVSRLAGVPIEPRGALAVYEPASGELTLWASTQVATPLRMVTAQALGMPEAKLRVIAPDVGGGFGNKDAPHAEEVLTAALAKRLGRPIKWIDDRREAMLAIPHARGQVHDVELTLDENGTIQSLRDDALVDAGAHLSSVGLGPGFVTAAMLPGPYRVPSFGVRVRGVLTNKTPMGAYRGFGMPEATYALERAMDHAGRQLGIDPAELRARNLIRPEEMPYTTATRLEYDSGDYPGALQAALKAIDYRRFRQEQPAKRAAGRLPGIGVVPYLEFTGLGPSAMQKMAGSPSGGYEQAVVRMDGQGGVTVFTGMASIGTGIKTSMAQVAAQELGIDPEQVSVVAGDTAVCPISPLGTIGSRSAPVGNAAVRAAARKVSDKLRQLAAHLLEAGPADVQIAGGRAFVAGSPERSMAIAEVAKAANQAFSLPHGMEPGLTEHAGYDPVHVTFSYGVHAVALEVDPETGAVDIQRYVVVHDCGPLVNPAIVEGQIQGGVAQGFGAAVLEELRFDEQAQPLTTTLADYMIPTATCVPELHILHTETPSPFTPDGAKGCGESGAIPAAPAIVAAIEDALAPYGVVLRTIPVTPEAIWRALRSAREAIPSSSSTSNSS